MTDDPTHSRRWLWLSIALLVLPALALWLVHSWLGWEGERLWQQAQARLKAEGETLDFMALVPKPVPDDENFFAVEPLKDIALVVDGDETKGEPGARRNQLENLCFIDGSQNPDRPSDDCVAYGIKWDAKAWASYYRASEELVLPAHSGKPERDLLAALKEGDPLVAKLQSGLDRPFALITPAWEDRKIPRMLATIPMTHFSAFQKLMCLLTLRAESEVAAGEFAQATMDVRVRLHLAEGIGHDPTLINGVLATAMVDGLMGNVWSLLEARGPSASDLLTLERDLARLDMSTVMSTAVRGEMAIFANSLDFFSEPQNNAETAYLMQAAKTTGGLREQIKMMTMLALWHLNPRAVVQGNKGRGINYLLDSQLLPIRQGGLKGLAEAEIKFEKTERQLLVDLDIMSMLMNVALPSVGSIGSKALRTETLVHQARLACALERYFLQHQRYPETLNELVPTFIDKVLLDPCDDKPMRYARTPAGRYKLWSLGFDGEDDGGKVIASPQDAPSHPKPSARDYPGDWVWSYERLVPLAEE